jgi:hypothetical protein
MKNNEVNNGFRSAQIVADLIDVPPNNVAEVRCTHTIISAFSITDKLLKWHTSELWQQDLPDTNT